MLAPLQADEYKLSPQKVDPQNPPLQSRDIPVTSLPMGILQPLPILGRQFDIKHIMCPNALMQLVE